MLGLDLLLPHAIEVKDHLGVGEVLEAESHLPGVFGRFFGAFNRFFARVTQSYGATVQRGIRRSAIALGIFGAVTAGAAWLVISRPGGFLPDEDQGFIMAASFMPDAASFERTYATMERLMKMARENPRIAARVSRDHWILRCVDSASSQLDSAVKR